ncbi:unnamed protein product, partial [Mesorhabditis belari]|uniref:Protein kinase domain-containing protein n=1 Tax=Mesorhabditis belari TaxID=2138241 RepID=A0AAF3FEZ0_9BILA
MRVGSSGSRQGTTGRLQRFSQSSIRANPSPLTSANAPGGAPLASADPMSGSRHVKHRFEIVKKLGSGTYGKVSLAYDHKMDREVAVKLIKKSAIENKADLVRIRREIRIMSALNHPNIIQIYEVFENKEKIILVMEYASGGELYDFVSGKGSLAEAEARRIFRQITSAVLYCHKHQVAHRDLKLENILLDEQSNAKIADFGLSNYFSDKNLLTTFCGSPLYASPEIINGTPYKGPEVDCWSLGILLYTLVYGSMPFDGRDFNRMVRQIKRGAYYEPETPSTASMLVRNMLRVNPERRATIFDIASHWWLNLDENMPVIQELPENQITDHTPLTERAETMVVQDLADETDVFMEFSHLSNETRKKIEEFRRRRKEAEEYNENCPVKPPKSRKTENGTAVGEEMRAEEKSLRGKTEKEVEKFDGVEMDPLERLRQIENKLSERTSRRISNATKVEEVEETKSTTRRDSWKAAPQFVGRDTSPVASSTGANRTPSGWRVETDSLNVLMNQVLEQMEKGPVSLNLVARIKAHPLYDVRPMVKELLESIMATQSETVQIQTSKIAAQKSQDVVSGSSSPLKSPVKKEAPKTKGNLEQRPWNSVEVGFDEDGLEAAQASTVVAPKGKAGKSTHEEGESEGDEYSDSELEELAEEVEQVEQTAQPSKVPKTAPKVEVITELAPPDPQLLTPTTNGNEPVIALIDPQQLLTNPQYLDAFDRGLIKRQSKGKYQHMMVDMYGRGIGIVDETEMILPRRRIGGPQPSRDLSPLLFDKAKKYIMRYPNVAPEDSDEELDGKKKKKKKKDGEKQAWRGIATHSKSPSPTRGFAGSVPPRTPPLLKSDTEGDEDEDEEEEEENEQSKPPQKPAFTSPTQPQPSQPSLATNGTVETEAKPMYGKYIVTVAELKSPISKISTSSVTSPITNGNYSTNKESIVPKEYNPIHLSASSRLSQEGGVNGGGGPGMGIGGTGGTGGIGGTGGTRETGGTGGTGITGITSSTRPRPQAYTRRAISSVGDTADLVAHYLGTASAIGMPSALSPNHGSSSRHFPPSNALSSGGRSFVTHRRRDFGLTTKETEKIGQEIGQEKENREEEKRDDGMEKQQDGDGEDGGEKGTTGKHSWESAAAYIRRKNRERRIRNRTIGDPEDVLRALSGVDLSSDLGRNDYSSGASAYGGTSGGYVSTYGDRSRARDYSPERDYQYSGARGGTSTHATPTSSRKFEEDSNAAPWNINRFEVYKTRAERNRDHAPPPSAASSYSRGSLYPSTGIDRNLSTYSASPSSYVPPSSTTYQSSYSGASYTPRSPYENATAGGYSTGATRRNFDYERSLTPGGSDGLQLSTATDTSSAASRRGVPRRVHSALSEQDRRNYARSRSTDRARVDLDHLTGPLSGVRSRLVTPELSAVSEHPGGYTSSHTYGSSNYGSSYGDHGYGHDRESLPRDDKPRSILKTKNDPDGGSSGSGGGVRGVIERLRRHLSLEKTQSPPPSAFPSTEAAKKKRSSIDMNRRKTSELRLGAEGTINTIGYSDSSGYKRSSPPRDTSKGLSWRTEPSTTSTDYPYLGSSSRYESSSAGDKYATGSYTNSSTKPTTTTTTRETAYVPQYRKYPGSSTGRDSSALNRYSYTPGATQRYTWYDDPNIY